MEIRIFTLPFDEVSEGFPDEIIAQFCHNKKVHSIKPRFFEREGRQFWSVAVRYETVLKGEEKVRTLDQDQQLLFQRLKEWRKEYAAKEGLPVYLLATNDHLLQMIKLKCMTMESFKQVRGFGKKRMEKYGRHIQNIIKEFYEKKPGEQEAPAMGGLPFD
jgi:superfamily II DNA helicase RecQ